MSISCDAKRQAWEGVVDADSYLVHLIGAEDASEFKHFRIEGPALAFATRQTDEAEAEEARVYRITGIVDARAAVASFQNGGATLLHTRLCKPSSDEAKNIRMGAAFRAADRGHFEEADRLWDPDFYE